MYTITIRKIDDDVAAKLKDIAARKNMSLESLARTLLTDFALHPEIKFLDEKYQAFFKDVLALYQSAFDDMQLQIEKNTSVLERILEGDI